MAATLSRRASSITGPFILVMPCRNRLRRQQHRIRVCSCRTKNKGLQDKKQRAAGQRTKDCRTKNKGQRLQDKEQRAAGQRAKGCRTKSKGLQDKEQRLAHDCSNSLVTGAPADLQYDPVPELTTVVTGNIPLSGELDQPFWVMTCPNSHVLCMHYPKRTLFCFRPFPEEKTTTSSVNHTTSLLTVPMIGRTDF